MFKIESYVTPILLSYVDKYVRDFKPANAQVSLWGGGVALHNLVLKEDVLQREVRLPFTLVSGRIHELLIQVPWTKIMSEPIVVTIDTIECVLNLKPPESEDAPAQEPPSRKTQVVEAPPGYMQALVRRIVSNISVKVHHLIVKYVQDDIVLSLNVKHLSIDSAGTNWEKAFADIDANVPVIRRLVQFDDFTLCLDKADADGKIRFYQEPLLYRCQLDLRILTRLVSANTRRASAISIQLRSTKLAWSVTSDQLMLLLRLLNERQATSTISKPQSATAKPSTTPAIQASSINSQLAEPQRTSSWSEWAWSWLPSWTDKEGGADDVPVSPIPLPLYFSAFLDEISLVYKIMEVEPSTNRKRFRSVLELEASFAAIKSGMCLPTVIRARFGARDLRLLSFGKCVCGFLNYDASKDRPTIYLKRTEEVTADWTWPKEQNLGGENDLTSTVKDVKRTPVNKESVVNPASEPTVGVTDTQPSETVNNESTVNVPEGVPEGLLSAIDPYELLETQSFEFLDEPDNLWVEMNPVIFMEFRHDRSPQTPYQNPYDNPPSDFEYSDWVEESHIKFKLQPMEVRACMGLIHRLNNLKNLFKDMYARPKPVPQMRVLTVEECDALNENLPERRMSFELAGLCVSLVPWNHSVAERPVMTPVLLNFELPKTIITVSGPLYPQRICAAACQMPGASGPLWQASRMNIGLTVNRINMFISSLDKEQHRPCVRADVRLVTHILLNKSYFSRTESVEISYLVKITNVNICGSAARLEAAWEVANSLIFQKLSTPLKCSSLARDALNDEDYVMIDFELEEVVMRGYHTRNVNTIICTVESAKATAFHEPAPGDLKQAWLFSAPDVPIGNPYLRVALQWCNEVTSNSLDYLGMWTEPTAVSMDPLLIAWLAYKPILFAKTSDASSTPSYAVKTFGSTQYLQKIRGEPSPMGSRTQDAERVHMRPRGSTTASSTEPSEKKSVSKSQKLSAEWWCGEKLVALHRRLRYVLINVEVGLTLVYVTMATVSAVDCVTLRDAMERHVNEDQRVLVLSLGRVSVTTNPANKYLWQELQHNGPTFIAKNIRPEVESFPWKIRIADMSCYTLEIHEDKSTEKTASQTALKSLMKTKPLLIRPRTILEMVTTTVTVGVVTKAMQTKPFGGSPPPFRRHASSTQKSTPTPEDVKTKYFKTGKEFKPTTLKEFIRGPARVKKDDEPTPVDKAPEPPKHEELAAPSGPLVSLGVNLHADTPPVIIRLERDQIKVIAAAIHGMNHILSLLKREQSPNLIRPPPTFTPPKMTPRSVSEIDERHSLSEESKSSEVVDILAPESSLQKPLKTFLWFQWVVSHVRLVVASNTVKLAFEIEDVISTVDIQALYHQYKIKIATASIRHFERAGSKEWVPGVLGGRVLEAREGTGSRDEDHFLVVTVTYAKFSNLPPSWKQELHPKLLEHKDGTDIMWEVSAVLAPLEVIIQPVILENIETLVAQLKPRALCPLQVETTTSMSSWVWPFCYVAAGGIRILITGGQEQPDADDTFVIRIGAITMNPHPENPVCRRLLNSTGDAWPTATSNSDGRQYEMNVKNFTIRSAQLMQLVSMESMTTEENTNPAVKWSQQPMAQDFTTVLHPVDICCVLAPAMYSDDVMTIGPAIDLNLVTDCIIDLNVSQIALWRSILNEMKIGCRNREAVYVNLMQGCPYANFIIMAEPDQSSSGITVVEAEKTPSVTGDSGVETLASTSKSRHSEDIPIRKVVSYAEIDQTPTRTLDFLEVFLTMGTVEGSLFVDDSDDSLLDVLRPPQSIFTDTPMTSQPRQTPTQAKLTSPQQHMPETKAQTHKVKKAESNRSITEQFRDAAVGHSKLALVDAKRIKAVTVPLAHVTLMQPNLYYWRNKGQKNIQVSLFNAAVGLGMAPSYGLWHLDLLTTASGSSDPVTGIPPALATLKIVAPVSGASASVSNRGSIKLDLERPVEILVSKERLRRLVAIYYVLTDNLQLESDIIMTLPLRVPILYRLRQKFLQEGIESVEVSTSQVGVCGDDAACGWDSASFQLAVGARTERINVRSLVTALIFTVGSANDRRNLVLHPLMLGAQMEATWEAWRRAEGGPAAREPAVRIGMEFDRITLDLRPVDLLILNKLKKIVKDLINEYEEDSDSEDSLLRVSSMRKSFLRSSSMTNKTSNIKSSVSQDGEPNSHYYQDDLRSGAFKILQGGQLPMAYQVILYGQSVSWRYPHPRSITRIVAFPMLGSNTEMDCVLEVFTPMLDKWEPHTYFKIPVGEPIELSLQVPAPEAVFATMWRFRACMLPDTIQTDYKFNIDKFKSRPDPLLIDRAVDETDDQTRSNYIAEQLSSILRVDSYFAPQRLPRIHLLFQIGEAEVHFHNSLPQHSSTETSLEGYYVSRPLMCTHRVFSAIARNTKVHVHLGSPAGVMSVADTTLCADVIDCSTGTMEPLIKEFRLQLALTAELLRLSRTRARVATSMVQVALHVPRLRTLSALGRDWTSVYEKPCEDKSPTSHQPKHSFEFAATLEGRVSLWVHNSTTSALRIGQEGTAEVVPLGPGAKLAYRWYSSVAPKKLHFAFAGPVANWQWSSSVPFIPISLRVKLEDPMSADTQESSSDKSVCVFVKVHECGSKRTMTLCGRLALANMLRFNFLYKVKARSLETGLWRTICSDEMQGETIGRSVICTVDTDLVLKIKRISPDMGWSGDIPLRECPKENVPWLVKVPTPGDMSYVSVWCRVVRGRNDGRILATVWPLYVLHSHLPLDTDVLITTEKTPKGIEAVIREKKLDPPVTTDQAQSSTAKPEGAISPPPPSNKPQAQTADTPAPLIQSTPGRGCSTHLLAPGTTADRHNLSFQYRNIESPVTREAVPLHYGVTDISVFDKRTPIMNIEEVKQEIRDWLKRSARTATSDWPYSIVSKHWNGTWQPALLQPRCDVTVRYQAVHAGGGCSLEVQLCPIVLLCNAVPITFTLRAHDAAPLCKVEGGSAISPPSAILRKPFYLSMEVGRETFVSQELQVSAEEPGRYGQLPPRHVALDHTTVFPILCNHKVALITMYYEIKHEINVIGLTSTFMIINRLQEDILVSCFATPNNKIEENELCPKSFKVVEPTPEGSISGKALSRFNMRGRWRGGEASALNLFISVALPDDPFPARTAVPVRLGKPPLRRAVALYNKEAVTIPVIVSQIKHEHRWLVVVAHDPCPQFFVHNQTTIDFYIGEPAPASEQANTSATKVIQECEGAQWWTLVPANATIYFSTPTYCLRYPPSVPSVSEPNPPVTMLTFCKRIDVNIEEWCAPVAVTDGEQLLQYTGGVTIKLRVTTHPHSTLLELRDTDQNDISASDIRRRLDGAVSMEAAVQSESEAKLGRLGAAHILKSKQSSLPRLKRPEDIVSVPKSTYWADEVQHQARGTSTANIPATTAADTQTATTSQPQPSSTHEDNTTPVADTQSTTPREPQATPPEPQATPTSNNEQSTPDATPQATLQEPASSPADPSICTQTLQSSTSTASSAFTPMTATKESPLTSTQPTLSPFGRDTQPSTSRDPQAKLLLQINSDDSLCKIRAHIDHHEHHSETSQFSETKIIFKDTAGIKAVESTYQCPNRQIEFTDMNILEGESSMHIHSADFEPSSPTWGEVEHLRLVMTGVMIEMAATADVAPLCVLHLDRTMLLLAADEAKTKSMISVADIQIDNLQYESGQYDFAVVASTRALPLEPDQWPSLWNMFGDSDAFAIRIKDARFVMKLVRDKWTVMDKNYKELTEIEVRIGSLALYVEDAYVTALIELTRSAFPPAPTTDVLSVLAEERALQTPLRLRRMYVHPLDLTLTLHTAVRMYIALDQSPLRLSAFKLHEVFTSPDQITHALTVHYLSAALLGAGWVVGGLELLGAPGALAARLGGASGGVWGVASATAAALIRSFSAWAGSLARNLDILAGDEDHARRAAVARRRLPPSFVAGLFAGITNFAINILGAVGGLAHHPLVGVAVGETESSVAALRRGIIGALTKPLSATADLVAFAGHGLLRQTGWDPVPLPRIQWAEVEAWEKGVWRRDCVRWTFRLAPLNVLDGFEVLVDNAPMQLFITEKYLVVADPENERIVEMIDFRTCVLGPHQGQIIELRVAQRKQPRATEGRSVDEDDNYHANAAAMARVARYTGTEAVASTSESRVLHILPMPGKSHSLYASLTALVHQNVNTHLSLL